MGHFLFILLFAAVGIRELLYFNIVSTSVYAACFFLNRKGCHNLAFYLGVGEIILHAAVTTAYLGWASSFHYYILCLVPFFYFCTEFTTGTKILHTALCMLAYTGLRYYSLATVPLALLEPAVLEVLTHINIAIVFASLAALSYFYSLANTSTLQDLKDTNRRLELLASVDPLTGLLNRRTMLKKIEQVAAQYQKGRKPFAIILSDIDNFKIFNDCYGHECGDMILTHTANVMKGVVRENDCISRWGGEEFLILLPQTDRDECRAIVERIKGKLKETPLQYAGTTLSVTLTFGISIYTNEVDITTLINTADKALYKGKNSGKDCIVY